MVIAIDGPSGSGKGLVANKLAQKLKYERLDTGATYRCVTLYVIENNIKNTSDIIKSLDYIKIHINNGNIFLNEKNVTDRIREFDVSEKVSLISNIIEVRTFLVDWQRNYAKNKNIVTDGRDTTTVVFPDADFKIYLDASLEKRAKRRYKEFNEKGLNISFEEVIDNIKNRDYNDMNKKVGALIKSDDAIYIDSSNLNADDIVEKICNEIGSD